MGKRYSREELEQIHALITEGLTNQEIASKLDRPEAGIRNLRYRNKMEAETRETIESLKRKRKELQKKIFRLELNHSQMSSEVKSLQDRKEKLSEAVSLNEQILNERLVKTLAELKHRKPKLFDISLEEQILEIAGLLTASFIKCARE